MATENIWFPQEQLRRLWRNRQVRFVLVALLVLAPVVLTIGIRTKLNHFRTSEFRIETNRQRCLEIARDFVSRRGVDASKLTWELQFYQDERFFDYVHRSIGEGRFLPRFRRFPWSPVAILVTAQSGPNEEIRLWISPAGDVVGYRLPALAINSSELTASREAAIARAREELDRVAPAADYTISPERVYEQADSAGKRLLRIEWTATWRDLPELSFVVRFGVAGQTVVSRSVDVELAESAKERESLVAKLYRGLTGLAPFYIGALILYMLARYIQRTLEKEVSHGRAVVVALYLLALIGLITLTGDQSMVLNLSIGEGAPQAVYIFIVFFLGLVTLLSGATYSACEGDVREYVKGSMTAFDVFLTGRLFSRNVARAFVVGFIAATWLFFLHVLGSVVLEGGMQEPGSLTFVYRMAHARFPAAMVFLLLPIGVSFVMLFGFLIPVSIISRFPQWRGTRALLPVMVIVNLFLLHGGFVTLGGAIFMLGTEAVFLLVLMYHFDLMTAFLCRVLVSYLTLLTDVQLLTQMPREAVIPIHGVVLATLLASLLLMRFGREYTDEEVRPGYARALAERQTLTAQLSAAAVAQAQLTQSQLPDVEGFSLAAECRPARVVSGDYYECFAAGPRSAGILLISGAGRGLLDAMVIAYTKGFLLGRVHSARSSQELLTDLNENLSTLLRAGDAFPELCYLFLDGEKRTASYSKTEGFPGVVCIRLSDGGEISVREGANAEMSTTRALGERSLTLRHGSLYLEDRDSLLLFSCGFARSLERSGIADFREWLRREWRRLLSTEAGSTLRKLAGSAFGGGASWQNQSGEDDRTLFVVQAVSVAAGEVERAA